MRLERLLIDSAARSPDAPAVHAPGQCVTYGELDRLSNQIAHALLDLGVPARGRVGIWLDKSVVAVAAMQAALRIGAAYVPLDPLSPRARIEKMLADCAPHALVTTSERASQVLRPSGIQGRAIPCLPVGGSFGGLDWNSILAGPADLPARSTGPGDLAYILYTSGSTGMPKGVCISHGNAWAFIEWAAATIEATAADHFSNHAPFHFDLSVLDLYVAFLARARVSLAPAGISYVPKRLVDFMREQDITVWYSVPSAITMMMDSGLLDDPALEPRVLLFAGEPFPVPQLARLRNAWKRARFFNFYGPTETNVCTAYEVLPDPHIGNLRSVPIGTRASHDQVWLETPNGIEIEREPGASEPGELIVDGPTVMLGYWGGEPQAGKPYRTGDIARWNEEGQLEFLGRRDHMVKVRGHRIELGEVESVLHGHPAVQEAAVAIQGSGRHARLIALLTPRGDDRPSLLAIKRLCAENLPRYMIVDRVRWLPALPRTRNGKLDRERLLDVLPLPARKPRP